jgi:predicted aldo/keto reductase-like oxidoreductase
MRTRTFSTLDAAYAAGVRYVDAARSYGRAEEFLAGWLAQSRALLGDRLSLYQVHSLTLDSGLFPMLRCCPGCAPKA